MPRASWSEADFHLSRFLEKGYNYAGFIGVFGINAAEAK